MQDLNYSIPTDEESKPAFNQHMVLDNKHGILFCYMPKVGCTNLKLLFFVNQGVVPHSELSKDRDGVNQYMLERVSAHFSFAGLFDEDKVTVLKTYFKFVMWRNPLERLASSYRSKVERFPLVGFKNDTPPYNWLRKAIYRKYHPELYGKWITNGGVDLIAISFADFIEYWLNHGESWFKSDEHFLNQMSLCHPCRVKFDFYANFKYFDRDAKVLMDKIGANSSDLRTGYYDKNTSTDERMKTYYSSLSEQQKRNTLKKFDLELQFYYSLFPEEAGSHLEIMQLSNHPM